MKETWYRFPCGCEWRVLAPSPREGALPFMDIDDENLPLDCPATWTMLGKGLTKGVFQLESSLGKQWTKKLKPENAEHISALGALLRPGCLRAEDEKGISMTQHYCRRKNNEEQVEIYHPSLTEILEPTYGVLVYQEQAMAIAKAVAAFTLQEADMLRKAIGKKLPEEMAKCKKMFVEGAAKAGILNEAQAAEVFGWIEKSQRYSFNKSHACSYGLLGYDTAYIKAHWPVAFFTSWLYYAKDKADNLQEIADLVSDAKIFDIEVLPPDLRNMQSHFSTDGVDITFGISDIKGVGEAQVTKLKPIIQQSEQVIGKKLADWNWYEFLVHCSDNLPSGLVTRLISVGALRWMSRGRRLMLEEFKAWESLTDKERLWVKTRSTKKSAAERQLFDDEVKPFSNIVQALEALSHPKYVKPKRKSDPVPVGPFGGCNDEKRRQLVLSTLQLLRNPPSSVSDTPHWIAWSEDQLLGIALSCSAVDACDTSDVNASCKDYIAGRVGYMIFGVEVKEAREVTTKKGKNPGQKMAFLTVADSSCQLSDVVVFPDIWKECSTMLVPGATVLIHGERDPKNDSLVVKAVWHL